MYKILIAFLLSCIISTVFAADNKLPPTTNADDLSYTPLNPKVTGDQAIMVHVLYGTLGKEGPVAFLSKIPAGHTAGWHTHSSDVYIVTIKGNYYSWFRGQSEGTSAGVGGKVFIPANVSHNNRCEEKSGVCLNYAFYPNGFDVSKE